MSNAEIVKQEKLGIATIDVRNEGVIVDEGGKFLIDKNAENQITKLLRAQKLIEEMIKLVKDKLGEQMIEQDVLKIQGENLSVSRRYFGDRFEVTDQIMAMQSGVAKESKSIKPDVDKIDVYIKEHDGNLPEGISLRERAGSITIKLRDE